MLISFNYSRKVVWRMCAAHIQLWAVVVCKLPSQTKVAFKPNNIRPVIIEYKYMLLGSQVSSFLRGRYRELVDCHKVPYNSPTSCSWEQQSYPGAAWTYIEDDHMKRRLCPSPFHEVKRFSQYPDQAGADETNWTSCFWLHDAKMFGSS